MIFTTGLLSLHRQLRSLQRWGKWDAWRGGHGPLGPCSGGADVWREDARRGYARGHRGRNPPASPPGERSMPDPARRRRAARKQRETDGDPATIRIVVADHQAIDRAGIVGLLDAEPDFEVVGEAASVDEAIQECRSLTPDVLILALNLAGNTESPALPVFRAKLPQLKVLALSERGHESCLVLNPPGSERLPAEGREWLCADGWDCL